MQQRIRNCRTALVRASHEGSKLCSQFDTFKDAGGPVSLLGANKSLGKCLSCVEGERRVPTFLDMSEIPYKTRRKLLFQGSEPNRWIFPERSC